MIVCVFDPPRHILMLDSGAMARMATRGPSSSFLSAPGFAAPNSGSAGCKSENGLQLALVSRLAAQICEFAT